EEADIGGGRLPEEGGDDIGQQPAEHDGDFDRRAAAAANAAHGGGEAEAEQTLPHDGGKEGEDNRDPERFEETVPGEQADIVVEADPFPVEGIGTGQLE